ncbi:hypothetical protein [Mesorhizobium ventifaucium]|uniref:Uncharacterized protein n=1 Tax=Mesorhizobium ventifaucium TaxID=666020 RepID=A0ABM9EDF1_9HYPH|nr:hypothetical protein [Mesorhizobium ventifaucium]CAH2407297.1 hypothetical protein MES4922_610006 [Mesorhizobium ventifaucium]
MAKAAGGVMHDSPSRGEIELFRQQGTQFQMISVVVSIAALKIVDGVPHATPYAISLIPASKRDRVDERPIDLIAKLDVQKFLRETQPCYMGYDPFAGDWSLFVPLGSLMGEKPFEDCIDTLGLVVEQYSSRPNSTMRT